MNFSLRLITPPTIEPVTVEEVKLQTRISYDDEDTVLAKWITAGRIAAENYQRRAFIAQQWEMWLDGFPSGELRLPRAPLMNIALISYVDVDNVETVIYSNDFNPSKTIEEPASIVNDGTLFIDTNCEPGRIGLKYAKTWPTTVLRLGNSVRIRYWSGYGATAETVDETVKDAIMLYCAWRNENRAGEVPEIPQHFYNLLNPGRLFTP